ncbi:MAG: hypothetical protein KI786_06875 [Mameliella sp.]|nr:hypothetical protein [Phaeodactylibacter sp.]
MQKQHQNVRIGERNSHPSFDWGNPDTQAAVGIWCKTGVDNQLHFLLIKAPKLDFCFAALRGSSAK